MLHKCIRNKVVNHVAKENRNACKTSINHAFTYKKITSIITLLDREYPLALLSFSRDYVVADKDGDQRIEETNVVRKYTKVFSHHLWIKRSHKLFQRLDVEARELRRQIIRNSATFPVLSTSLISFKIQHLIFVIISTPPGKWNPAKRLRC